MWFGYLSLAASVLQCCSFASFSDPSMEPYPHQFATALFSFLYHLASYDAGGEALVSCGMMEALLKVIWSAEEVWIRLDVQKK